jgi:sulfate transport system ATP-binding protein
MLGSATASGVRVGPVIFPIDKETPHSGDDRRVQVLFRPEDVALAPASEALDCPRLGQGEIEESTFGGSFERLRLRLPPLPGVRPIAPPVPFGSDTILVDVTRSPDEALRFPLQAGERAWVGVRRIHALAHPGLNFLIVTDGSLRAQAAITLGGQIARLAHARVTLLGCGEEESILTAHLQEARKQLGSGLAALEIVTSHDLPDRAVAKVVERQPYDLVVLGFSPQEDVPLAEHILQTGEHHLLLVPSLQPAPVQALICVTSGEPGKDDVMFAGRLVRHLGADATLLNVLPGGAQDPELHRRTERFLAGGVQSLSILSVPAKTAIRTGLPKEEILAEMKSGGYDLLVVGAPLTRSRGEVSLSGVVKQVLSAVTDHATLVVRSHYIGARTFSQTVTERSFTIEEMVG